MSPHCSGPQTPQLLIAADLRPLNTSSLQRTSTCTSPNERHAKEAQACWMLARAHTLTGTRKHAHHDSYNGYKCYNNTHSLAHGSMHAHRPRLLHLNPSRPAPFVTQHLPLAGFQTPGPDPPWRARPRSGWRPLPAPLTHEHPVGFSLVYHLKLAPTAGATDPRAPSRHLC